MRLLIYGFGFTGRVLARRLISQGSQVTGTSRTTQGRAAAEAFGVAPVDPADTAALVDAALAADALLIAAPPQVDGCPGLQALGGLLEARRARPSWIGYLSTTGVYGDRQGRWVFEDSPLHPQSPEAERRARAESGWRALTDPRDLKLDIFRLPGIYGPGRSVLDRLRAGAARRVVKPGHVFSRIHVDDLADALHAAMQARKPGRAYNICDDEPCAPAEVTAYAAALLGQAPPPETPFDPIALSPMAARFWAESKRASNARAKATLGWRPAYPSYREGLAAVLAADQGFRSFTPVP